MVSKTLVLVGFATAFVGVAYFLIGPTASSRPPALPASGRIVEFPSQLEVQEAHAAEIRRDARRNESGPRRPLAHEYEFAVGDGGIIRAAPIHTEPNEKSVVLADAQNGTVVVIKEVVSSDWCQVTIRTDDGRVTTGYIRRDHITGQLKGTPAGMNTWDHLVTP